MLTVERLGGVRFAHHLAFTVPSFSPMHRFHLRFLFSFFRVRSSINDSPLPIWGARVRRVFFSLVILAAVILAVGFAAAFGPRLFGYSTFVVYGGSMEPTIRNGSVAVAKPVSADSLKVGQIVAYQESGSSGVPTVHRIVEIGGPLDAPVFTLQGDANQAADPLPVNFEGTGSRVIYSVPLVGRLIALTQVNFVRTMLTWLPALVVVLILLKDIWTPSKPKRIIPAAHLAQTQLKN